MLRTLYLVGDIGGTHARFALCDKQGELHHIACMATTDFATLRDAMRAYLAAHDSVVVQHAALAIATPVLGDEIQMTNHHWHFSIQALQKELDLQTLHVLNDFTAQALAILRLPPESLRLVCGTSQMHDHLAKAVIGPGTGLGVSGLIPDGRGQWIALAGEGGHVSFTPRNVVEEAILSFAMQRYSGHISAERLISGSGLGLIDAALADQMGQGGRERLPAEISAAALAGEDRALAAVNHFFAMLATVASDLALTLGARGGVYLCGGILPRMANLLMQSGFAQRFTEKGRFATYLANIPVLLVTDAQASGLIGAAIALRQVMPVADS